MEKVMFNNSNSGELKIVYCFGCWKMMSVMDDEVPDILSTDEWVKDKAGRVFSMQICDDCRALIKTVNVMKDVTSIEPPLIDNSVSKPKPKRKSNLLIDDYIKNMETTEKLKIDISGLKKKERN